MNSEKYDIRDLIKVIVLTSLDDPITMESREGEERKTDLTILSSFLLFEMMANFLIDGKDRLFIEFLSGL